MAIVSSSVFDTACDYLAVGRPGRRIAFQEKCFLELVAGEPPHIRAVCVCQHDLSLVRLVIFMDERECLVIGRDASAAVYVVADLARRAAKRRDLVKRAVIFDVVDVVEVVAVAREAQPLQRRLERRDNFHVAARIDLK